MLSISVIIPTKNRPVFLERAVNSVLSQSYKVNEIIIVDDCSDNTQYDFVNDERIILVKNTISLGGAGSRNLGVKRATSDIIMFLDDDDSWDKDKVKSQIDYFSDENTSLVFSGKQVVYDDDLNKTIRRIIPKKKLIDFTSLCECNYIGSTSSVALRRCDFEVASGFDESLKCFQDYDLWLRICKKNNAVFDNHCNVFYTVFRKEGMQISRSVDGRHIKAADYLISKYSSDMSYEESKAFKMNLYQLVSKALNFSKPLKAISFSIKSILIKPSIRGFKFLFASFASLIGYKHG